MDDWAAFARTLGLPSRPGHARAPLHFRLEGRDARLEELWIPNSDSDGRVHRLTVDFRGVSPGTLKIHPEGFFSPIAKLFGAQDLKIGDRAFDALYVVKASPASLAASVFGGRGRERLIATIRALGRYMSPLVDLSRERLRVQTGEFLTSRALLERMLDAARELTAALLAVKGSVLLWEEPGLPAGARCPVCGTRFAAAVTICRACRTPHHHECWIYAGGCSTYACGERGDPAPAGPRRR